jgi:hypothetical protein
MKAFVYKDFGKHPDFSVRGKTMKPSKKVTIQYTMAQERNETRKYYYSHENWEEILNHPETYVEETTRNSLGRDGDCLYTRIRHHIKCPAYLLKAR